MCDESGVNIDLLYGGLEEVTCPKGGYLIRSVVGGERTSQASNTCEECKKCVTDGLTEEL